MEARVLPFEDALKTVQHHAQTLATRHLVHEEVDLLATFGRVLAADVRADRDLPPFDRSTRDGFAVCAKTWNAAQQLRIAGQIRAGELWHGGNLVPGTALEIMTGAPVPAGADAVVMIEHVERDGDLIRATRSLRPGENIVPRGSEARAGTVVIPAGTVFGAAEIALAAACGQAKVEVFRKPRVAILATGDELVELDQTPQPQQIRNSNSYALAAMVIAAGGQPARGPIVPDRLEAVETAIRRARHSNLLVLSGGVSMGQYDLVEEVLAGMGAEFFFTGVQMQPGKPVVFGRLPATADFPALFFFGLPGNPVSTEVTFHVFVETMLGALAGAEAHGPRFVLATLGEAVTAKPELTRLLPAHLAETEVRLVKWQGSGDLAANARANCYVLLPPGAESFLAGATVRILLR